MGTARKRSVALGVSMLLLACLTNYGCAKRYSGPPVVEEGDTSHYPPASRELPQLIADESHAIQQGCKWYGRINVIGSKDTALKEAAKRGAEAVTLEAAQLKAETGRDGKKWTEVYIGRDACGRDVYKVEPVPGTGRPVYGTFGGYVVNLYKSEK